MPDEQEPENGDTPKVKVIFVVEDDVDSGTRAVFRRIEPEPSATLVITHEVRNELTTSKQAT